MKSSRTINPKIVAVRINETRYWTDDVRGKVKAIYAHYLFDENLVTHICSFEKNYFLRFVGFDFESDLEDDEKEKMYTTIEEAYNNGDDQDHYYLIGQIDRIPLGDWNSSGEYKKVYFTEDESAKILEGCDADDENDEERKFWDNVFDSFNSNPIL